MDRRALCLILLLSAAPFAGHAAGWAPAQAEVTLGLASRWLEFDYTSDAELEKDIPSPAGVMVRELGTTYFLRMNAPLGTQGHFAVEAGFGPFDLNRQRVDDREQTRDLGTRIRGYYAHVTPMVTAFMPSKTSLPLRYGVGLGVGIGYLRAYGDMVFTEDGSNALQTVDIGGIGLSIAFFLQIDYDHWQSRLQAASPTLNRDGGAYSMNLFSWDLGYRIAF